MESGEANEVTCVSRQTIDMGLLSLSFILQVWRAADAIASGGTILLRVFPAGTFPIALYATPASAFILYNPLYPLNEHVVSRIALLVNLSIRYTGDLRHGPRCRRRPEAAVHLDRQY